jgi:hypothetical protein
MSNGDFEVMPRGTMEELKVLRRFANEMLALSAIHDMPVPHEMQTKIHEVARFYNSHVEKYPV